MTPVKFRNQIYAAAGIAVDEIFLADASLANYQYCLVAPASTVGYVKLSTGTSNPAPLGILQNAPGACEIARVRMFGFSQVATCVNSAACDSNYGRFLTASASSATLIAPATLVGKTFGRWLDTAVTAATGCSVGKAYVDFLGTTCPIAAS